MDYNFHRIKRLPPYVFTEVNEMKARARGAGKDVIDFGMENPDSATPQHVVEKLVETVANPQTHRYSTSRGILGLRRANAEYYSRRFGVDIDPETETIVTLGSKEGFANLAQVTSAPGDVIIVPNPSYSIYGYGFIRIALVESRYRIRQAKRNIKRFLGDSEGIMERAEQRVTAS